MGVSFTGFCIADNGIGQENEFVFNGGFQFPTTEYIDGIQYTNTNIDFVQTEEGRAINTGTNYNYEYTLTDHLGNNRVTFDMTNGKVGEDDYYPFGLNVHRVQNAGNKYLYNKKELQEELTEYDYGARFYDPVIARWRTVDPLAEKHQALSSFEFVADNPLKFIDPDGKDIWFADRTDDHSGLKRTQDLINRGLGGTYATIDELGHLDLNVSTGQYKNLTDEQKGFYDVINSAATDKRGDVNIDIAADSKWALVGDYVSQTIDIADVEKFGKNQPGADESSIFGHELAEQQAHQLSKSNGFNDDHEIGKAAEGKIKGVTRSSTEKELKESKLYPNSDSTQSGFLVFTYTDNKNKQETVVTIYVSYGNVADVTHTQQ